MRNTIASRETESSTSPPEETWGAISFYLICAGLARDSNFVVTKLGLGTASPVA